VLRREDGGYRLVVEPHAVDAERFTELAEAGATALAEGDARLAVQRLDAALALWRGTPFADLGPVTFADSTARYLETVRAAAREDRIAAGLALGGHRRLLNQTVSLTDDYPLRENAWGLRALTLYRSGQRAEALQVLQAIRARLRKELGVPPGPRLSALYKALVTQDSTLDRRPEASRWPRYLATGAW